MSVLLLIFDVSLTLSVSIRESSVQGASLISESSLKCRSRGRQLVPRGSPRARGRRGIDERDLFIQTVMKSGVEALQVLCGDGEISPWQGLQLGSGQVQLAVGK